MLQFNENIGRESYGTEFKGFSFYKTGMTIDKKEAEQCCQDKKFIFDDLTSLNLDIYIEQYVPRYACAFINSLNDSVNESLNDNTEKALFFGVNDFGFVKGIPHKDSIRLEKIREKIQKTFSTNLRTTAKLNFKVEVIEVDRETVPVPEKDVPEKFTKYLAKKDIYMKRYQDFVDETNKVKEKYDIINLKLVDIFNTKETRLILQEYIRKNDPTNPVLEIISSDYQLMQISGEELRVIKTDPTNPYYWVTTYKDSIIEEYKKHKPIFNDLFRKTTPLNLLISVDEMIPYWIHSNLDLKLAVIKITFYFEKDVKDTEKKISTFFDITTQKWTSCKRVIEKGQPMCIPIEF
jgi:hypothetical protein